MASTAERHEVDGSASPRLDGSSRIARLVAFNEALAIASHSLPGTSPRLRFLCECGSVACRGLIRLPLSEYERIRRNGGLLWLVGHDVPA